MESGPYRDWTIGNIHWVAMQSLPIIATSQTHLVPRKKKKSFLVSGNGTPAFSKEILGEGEIWISIWPNL